MVDNSDEFFTGVRNCYVVMLTFAAFFSKVFSEGIIPITDKLCGIKKCITQISGAAFLHVRIG